MTLESRSPSFIPVPCKCGRSLRAKPDQVGTEIRCWDCHQMVMVSLPRDRQRVARELSVGLLGVIRGQGLTYVMIAAAILTAALCVPKVGIGVAAALLTLGSIIYGEIVSRVSRVEPDPDRRGWASFLVPRSVVGPILGILMAAGTVVPLWALNPGDQRSPHWTSTGALIAGLTWTALPIAMLCACGRDRQGRLGIRKCLGQVVRHPLATLLALAVVPASLASADAFLGGIFYAQGNLPFFALDFMPIPGDPLMLDGVPHYHMVDFRSYPQTRFIGSYVDSLRHGYTFSAAIPASMSLPTRAGLNPSILHANDATYFGVRLFLVFLILTFLLVGFAIQACWLGAIAAVGKKRPA